MGSLISSIILPVPKSQSCTWCSGRQEPVSTTFCLSISSESPQIWGPYILRTAFSVRLSQICTVLSHPPLSKMWGSMGCHFNVKMRFAWPAVVVLLPPESVLTKFLVASSYMRILQNYCITVLPCNPCLRLQSICHQCDIRMHSLDCPFLLRNATCAQK